MGFFESIVKPFKTMFDPIGTAKDFAGKSGKANELLFGKEGSVSDRSSLSSAQQPIETSVGNFLRSRIGKGGLPGFAGDLSAGISPFEQQGLDSLGKFIDQERPSSLDATSGALERSLSGDPAFDINPATTEDFIQRSLFDPARHEFETRTLPALQEQFAGAPSNFFTTERRIAESRARGDLENSLQGQAAGLRFQDEQARRQSLTDAANRTNTALGFAPGINQQSEEFDLRKTQASQQFGALPRLLEQESLDRQLQEFIRTLPEMNPAIQQALQLIATPTTNTIVQPGTQGIIGPLIGAAGAALGGAVGGPVGAAAGGQIGSSVGGGLSRGQTPVVANTPQTGASTNTQSALTRF